MTSKYYDKDRLEFLHTHPRWPISPEHRRDLSRYHSQDALNSTAGLADMLRYISGQSIMITSAAEIGCYRGVSTECLAMFCEQLYAIDPWADDPAILAEFQTRMMPYHNVITIREASPAVCAHFQYGQFDLVYIDGMHTYNEVVLDIEHWLPLVRPGGFLCGHDYVDYEDSWMADWIQVQAAVHDTLGEPHQVFSDSSWLWRKPA